MQWRLVEYLHNKSAPESSNAALSYVFHLHLKTLAILQITHKSLKQCAHLLLLSSRPPEGSRPSLSTWWAPIQRTAQREVFNLLPHSLVLCALQVLQVTLPHAVFSMKNLLTDKNIHSDPRTYLFLVSLLVVKESGFAGAEGGQASKQQENCPCYHILLGERLAEKPPALALAPMHCQDFLPSCGMEFPALWNMAFVSINALFFTMNTRFYSEHDSNLIEAL